MLRIFILAHTFQHKRYISIGHTENFIMHALGPFCSIDPKCQMIKNYIIIIIMANILIIQQAGFI